jgi:hypothetical protein
MLRLGSWFGGPQIAIVDLGSQLVLRRKQGAHLRFTPRRGEALAGRSRAGRPCEVAAPPLGGRDGFQSLERKRLRFRPA